MGGVKIQLHALLTWALHENGQPAAHFSYSISTKRTISVQQAQEQLICIRWQGPRGQFAARQHTSHNIAWLPT